MYTEHVIYVIIAAVVGGMLLLVVMVIFTAVIIAVVGRNATEEGKLVSVCTVLTFHSLPIVNVYLHM